MVVVIDNYDSFTYNLVQYLGELGATVAVRRNDETTVEEISAIAPERILISPGPGRPEGAGITLDVIREFVLAISQHRLEGGIDEHFVCRQIPVPHANSRCRRRTRVTLFTLAQCVLRFLLR